MRPRLYILAPSHYCERARWGLDHAGIDYDEIRWAPVLHLPLARRLAPATSLPILQTGTAVIQGSDRILDWLGTEGGAPAVEQRMSEVIAPLARRFLYAATLADPHSRIRCALLEGVPTGHRLAGHLLWPLIRRLMTGKMAAHPEHLADLQGRLENELAWFDTVIGQREHLVGNRLGRADITAASLLAPLVRGPAVVPLYDRVRLPPAVEQALLRWSRRPSLTWVRGIYATHRAPL